MELVVCMIVGAIIFLNPEKAEDMGKTFGSFLKSFKQSVQSVKEEKDEIIEPIKEIKKEINSK